MTELEAIEIATQFMLVNGEDHQGVIRAFRVPLSAYGTDRPRGAKEKWAVHFRVIPPKDSEFVELLSSDRSRVIVSVDVETKAASFLSTL